MKIRKREIKIYMNSNGYAPFEEWRRGLSIQARVRIQTRVDRGMAGNFGDYKYLKDGVFEFRIHVLSGLRIYFGQDGNEIVVLLCGGSKKTQKQDIKKAKEYWQDYLRRKLNNVH